MGRRHHRHGPTLIRSSQVHGLLQVLWLEKLDVDLDMLGEAANTEVCLLTRLEAFSVAEERVEALLVILHAGSERKECQFEQAIGANCWTDTLVVEVDEALPRRHALILLEGTVPRLLDPRQMIGDEPDAVSQKCLLP